MTRRPAAKTTPPRRRPAWLPAVVVGAGVAIVAAVALLSASSAGEKQPAVNVTDPARFDLPALVGDDRVRLADFEGTPVVVNFFASWCGPCETELPVFARAARALEGEVAFVAVNSQEVRPPAGLALARRHRLEESGITLARDVGGRAGSLLHDALGSGMPVNAFYDADGNLLDAVRGALLEERLSEKLRQFYGTDLEL